MRLLTLGGLQLDGSAFARTKPLVLLVYLALEGVQERRYLAELFWPGARDPMNCLSVALSRLRKISTELFDADDVRIWSELPCDATDFLEAARTADTNAARALYCGPFLHGVQLPDWSVELEEWVYERREDLAARLRARLSAEAERLASFGDFAAAREAAEEAVSVEYAPALEPEELTRLYTVLQAAGSHLAAPLRNEAAGYGIDLSFSSAEAKQRLQGLLLGRDEERQRLAGLAAGEWAWVQGAPGMGKTALLKSLDGIYLRGRPGLPFATLEPLAGSAVEAGEGPLLALLKQLPDSLLIDDWERVDDESRALLRRLRDIGSRARLIVTSRHAAPFKCDLALTLQPLPRAVLRDIPGAWEATQGLPAFLAAFLRGEELAGVLAERIEALDRAARELLLTLALQERPDLPQARRALELDTAMMAAAAEKLLQLGLIEPHGQVRVRQAVLDYLGHHPSLYARLALQLARTLEPLAAFPLFERSRHLWAAEEEPQAVDAYLAWAQALLERGFPERAVGVLDALPLVPPLRERLLPLKARALERAGRFREALELLEQRRADKSLDASLDASLAALRATLLWRLGRPEEARQAAQAALGGDLPARAEALTTLGDLARHEGAFAAAASAYRRAAALWHASGRRQRQADALNSLAVTQFELGEAAERTQRTFEAALAAAGDNPMLRTRILHNLVVERQRRGDLAGGIEACREIIRLAEEAGVQSSVALGWNTLGTLYHRQQQLEQARAAYETALEVAARVDERRLQGMAMANLAELEGDAEAWEEALRLLEDAGHSALAERFRRNLAPEHPFHVEVDPTTAAGDLQG